MKYIRLKDVLQSGQGYVENIAQKLEIDVKAVRHSIATNTCFEKAELIGWPAERIVKSIFLCKEENVYGFVFPELGENSPRHLDIKKIIPKILKCSKKQAKKFSNSYCPYGMEYGTCTPFVLEDSFKEINGKELKEIFIHDMLRLEDSLVDISIGGFGAEAHKTSLHLPYNGIYDILNYRFKNKIHKMDLF